MTTAEAVRQVAREIELKLAVDPADLERLATSPVLVSRLLGPARRRRLVSVYFDTPDGRLRTAGYALRVRRIGGRRVQTLKGPSRGLGATADRLEIELPVATDTPDLAAFPAEVLAAVPGLGPSSALVPIFTTRCERTELRAAWPAPDREEAVVVAALDRGAIEAGDRAEPIAELELELERGSRRALAELVAELRAVAPLAVEPRDKATRGFALALGIAPPPHKAPRLALPAAATVADAFRTIGLSAFGHALANLAPAADGRDPEGVHQLRVALRRLRSALSLFRPLLPSADRDRLNGELRHLLGELGPARDLDVLESELLAPLAEIEALAPELETLRGLLAEHRPELYERVRRAVGARRTAELFVDLLVWFELERFRGESATAEAQAAWDGPLQPFARERLERRWRKVKKLGRRFDALDARGRHELRIAVKKLRYAIDFLGSVWGRSESRRYASQLAELQDRLGHLNDLAVALDQGRGLLARFASDPRIAAAGLAAGALVGWHARGMRRLLREARDHWEALLETEPFWRDGS